MQGLPTSSPHVWRHQIKKLTDLHVKPELQQLIHAEAGNGVQLFADTINSSCNKSHVCSSDGTDVPKEFSIQPYEVFDSLSRVNVHN
jgi:hypothetical protein